jgi:hypothetical protein
MQQRVNRQWILKARPEGMVDPSLFVKLVPFLDFGYTRSRLELVSFAEFAIPTNQSADEEIETELEYTFSSL